LETAPYLVGLPLHVEYALCPTKTAHKSNAYASSSWCLNQLLKLFPRKHMRKTLASILSEKATAIIKRVRECRTQSTMYDAKEKRAGNLSRFHGTKPVILKPVIRGSNMTCFSSLKSLSHQISGRDSHKGRVVTP